MLCGFPCACLLDLPLLQNSVTSLMAMLPETIGVRRMLLGLPHFIYWGEALSFPHL